MANNQNIKSHEIGYITSPFWAGTFFISGGIATVVIGVIAWLFGYSASDDRVFAFDALCGGLLSINVMQKYFKKRFLIAPKVTIPFYYLWSLLCLYIFLFKPLN